MPGGSCGFPQLSVGEEDGFQERYLRVPRNGLKCANSGVIKTSTLTNCILGKEVCPIPSWWYRPKEDENLRKCPSICAASWGGGGRVPDEPKRVREGRRLSGHVEAVVKYVARWPIVLDCTPDCYQFDLLVGRKPYGQVWRFYLERRTADDASALPVDTSGEIDCLTRTDIQRTLQSLNDLLERVRFVIVDGCRVYRSVELRPARAEITSIHRHRSAIAFFDLHNRTPMK